MAIADRYARRLVADTHAPVAVLLVERAGELDVVMLDGVGPDAIPRVRLLLGQSGATSAAVLVDLSPAAFWIFGESVEGTTARRRYRVRPCVRTRRLTPTVDGDNPEVEGVFRPLFPVRIAGVGADDGIADAPSTTTPTESADAVATTGRIAAV
jgi:hypothetical protein